MMIKECLAYTAVLILIGLMSGCATSPEKPAAGLFTHGVASGDPHQESVVLWTRFQPHESEDVSIEWEVAEHSSFEEIINKGKVLSKLENDHCVKVIADDLLPGKTYYYRFRHGTSHSSVGRTRTLPEETDHIRIGVANCAKYTGGWYHGYHALANMHDLDYVIHLGDYIYESGPTEKDDSYWPAYLATGRQHDPQHECLSLDDYRRRYRQYRSDTSLQRLHANHPVMAIWDDHDIAMKPLKELPDGSMQYNGDWEGRLNNSLKAWHEYIPMRPNAGDLIYRSFAMGNLVNLLMLDTRVCCKDSVPKTIESLADTTRHIVGTKQLEWMFNEIDSEAATWNLLANQLLIAEKDMGWNRWQGFPADRNRLLNYIKNADSLNFLVTTGNAHNPHHYVIFEPDGTDTLLHEVLPGSISSGNNAEKAFFNHAELDSYFQKTKEAGNVAWLHQDSHGFLVIDMNRTRARVDWYFVNNVRTDGQRYELTNPYHYTIQAK